MRKSTVTKSLAALLTMLITSVPLFAQVVDDHAKAKRGAEIGGVAGAIAGAILGNNRGHHSTTRGAVVGTIAGAGAGAIVGAMMDRQERELRQIQGVNVTRTSPDELKVTVKNDVLFDTGSSSLRSASRTALRDMADVFDKYSSTVIEVQGYTDSVGSEAHNQRLSERRAGSVASYLEQLGVDNTRVDPQGYGESSPRASNNTPSGRQLNRRVEIHIRATQA